MTPTHAAIRADAEPAHEGPVIDRANGHDIIECIPCGFRHVVPLPGAETLAGLYRETYYADTKPSYLVHAREDAAWSALADADRLAAMEDLLAGEAKAPLRLIEIGSGPGFFLAEAMRRGWNAIGFEPSAQAAAHARSLGATVREEFFTAAAAHDWGAVDAIHLNNVLEHVPDPARILSEAVACLGPNGVLCVSVPNDYNGLQRAVRAAGTRPWWLAPPHHLNYFSFVSLERLLRRIGAEPQQRLTSFPMELFLLMGDDYVDDPSLGRACHKRRVRSDQTLEALDEGETRRRLYRALAEAGLGRDATVIARRAPAAP